MQVHSRRLIALLETLIDAEEHSTFGFLPEHILAYLTAGSLHEPYSVHMVSSLITMSRNIWIKTW